MATVTHINKYGWSRRDVLEYKLAHRRRDEYLAQFSVPSFVLHITEVPDWGPDAPYYNAGWYLAALLEDKPDDHFAEVDTGTDPYVSAEEIKEAQESQRLTKELKEKIALERSVTIGEQLQVPTWTEAGLNAAYAAHKMAPTAATHRHLFRCMMLFANVNLNGSVFKGSGGYNDVKNYIDVEDYVQDLMMSVIKNGNGPSGIADFYSWWRGVLMNMQKKIHRHFKKSKEHTKKRTWSVRDEVDFEGQGTDNSDGGDDIKKTVQESDAIAGQIIMHTRGQWFLGALTSSHLSQKNLSSRDLLVHEIPSWVKGLDLAIAEFMAEGHENDVVAQLCNLTVKAVSRRQEKLRQAFREGNSLAKAA